MENDNISENWSPSDQESLEALNEAISNDKYAGQWKQRVFNGGTLGYDGVPKVKVMDSFPTEIFAMLDIDKTAHLSDEMRQTLVTMALQCIYAVSKNIFYVHF